MKRFQHIAAKVELFVASVMFAAIVILVFGSALSRYLFTPINWSVDAAQGLFVWVVFLGASQAMRRGRHLGVDLFIHWFGDHQRRWIRIGLDCLTAVFLLGIVVYGVQVSMINYNRQFPSFPLSYSWVTIAASVGGLLMLITKLEEIIARFTGQPENTTS